MQTVIPHPWDLTPDQALELQSRLAPKVETTDRLPQIQYVAGVDVAYAKETDELVAAVTVLDANTHEHIETSLFRDKARFPYIPGLFSFRELPPLAAALERLRCEPDLIICDGQGLAHPRRFGLACHLGVLFDVPTIGCGKTRLIGDYQEPGLDRGSHSGLIADEEVVGSALRTQNRIKPIYVSIGHRVSLATAREWVLKTSPHYRLPETTRSSDQAVRRALKEQPS